MPSLATFSSLGHGPTVLMLHGSGGNFRSFAPQVEALASVGFRGVSWNMPGYGQSAPIEPYSFMGLAASCVHLIEVLMADAPRRSVALVGHGMGGMLAQEVAVRRPDLVRPEVRERVRQTARDLGYAGPDPRGRLLRAGKSNAIGVATAVSVTPPSVTCCPSRIPRSTLAAGKRTTP